MLSLVFFDTRGRQARTSTMLSIERGPNKTNKVGIAEGDILTVHYTTYAPVATANEFEVLVGDQCEEIDRIMRPE